MEDRLVTTNRLLLFTEMRNSAKSAVLIGQTIVENLSPIKNKRRKEEEF